MGALSLGEVVRCSMCRGHGWRFVSSWMVASVRAVDGGEERIPRRACAGCAGTGSLDRVSRSSAEDLAGVRAIGRGIGMM